MSAPLLKLGKPRVIEVALPLSATKHGYRAARAVIATFARSLGAIAPKSDFDAFVDKALPAKSVIAVHTEGEATFAAVGRDYPEGYIDIDIGYWKELTGEDD